MPNDKITIINRENMKIKTLFINLLGVACLSTVLSACNSGAVNNNVDSDLSTIAVDCSNVPAWNATQTYTTAGTVVVYNGVEYSSNWWNQGENPESNNGISGQPWTIVGTCNGNTPTPTPTPTISPTPAPTPLSGHIVVGYVDGTSQGAVAQIPNSAYSQYDVIVVGFSNCNANNTSCSTTDSQDYLSLFQTISANAKPNAVILLSIGGQNGSYTFASPGNMQALAAGLVSDIQNLNSQITTPIKIAGVDLDIEAANSGVNITPLAQALHNANLVVSIAPQASTNSPGNSTVNPATPNNFILTASGMTNNDYGSAVAAGYVNYINLQAYNSDASVIQINGSNEGMTNFQQNMAQVMNSLVANNCGTANSNGIYANGNQVCIPPSTKITIGTVANAIAGGTATMWENEVETAAGNTAILTAFNQSVQAATAYPYYGGVMVWALTNDYDPTAWSDTWDPAGAFTNNIPNFNFTALNAKH